MSLDFQGHLGFLGCPVSFGCVAVLACRHHVRPRCGSPLGSGDDMVKCGRRCGKFNSTISTAILITFEDVLPGGGSLLVGKFDVILQDQNFGDFDDLFDCHDFIALWVGFIPPDLVLAQESVGFTQRNEVQGGVVKIEQQDLIFHISLIFSEV